MAWSCFPSNPSIYHVCPSREERKSAPLESPWTNVLRGKWIGILFEKIETRGFSATRGRHQGTCGKYEQSHELDCSRWHRKLNLLIYYKSSREERPVAEASL